MFYMVGDTNLQATSFKRGIQSLLREYLSPSPQTRSGRIVVEFHSTQPWIKIDSRAMSRRRHHVVRSLFGPTMVVK